MIDTITISPSFVKVTAALGDAEVGRLFRAMCEYALTGTEPELRGNERVLFPAAKMMIDENLTCDLSDATREKDKERTKEKEKERDLSNNKNKYSPDFEEFWEIYPRKIDKQKAYKSWLKINPSDELKQYIIQSVKEWSACDQWQDENYIPHPTVWLNNRRWESAPAKSKKKNPAQNYSQRPPMSEDEFRKLCINLDEEDDGHEARDIQV